MLRMTIEPRKNWQKIVEKQGLAWHSLPEKYWDESVYYQFSSSQVDELETATNSLHEMCLQAVQYVIDYKKYNLLKIPEKAISIIEKSWNEEHPSLYGRFDFSYDGINPPKMLEYNADTPTSLLESSCIQWFWLKDVFPKYDQFNSIHDKLIAKFKDILPYLKSNKLYFTSLDINEDGLTTSYLQDVASQVSNFPFIKSYKTKYIDISDIGWNGNNFIDKENYIIENIFKLYPWEWLINEEYSDNLIHSYMNDSMFWIEPPWKMILSNKGILPILWELFPNHPNLLPSYFNDPQGMISYAKKPLLSREGANIDLVETSFYYRTPGEYGEEGFVYQHLCKLPNFSGNYPVIGSWMIDQESAGIGIRESNELITTNTSRFVPHVII